MRNSSTPARQTLTLTLKSVFVISDTGATYDCDGIEDGGFTTSLRERTLEELIAEYASEVYEFAGFGFWCDNEGFDDDEIDFELCVGEVHDLSLFLADLREYISNTSDGWARIVSKAEHDAAVAEHERKRLESTAAAFSHKCGYPVASREYIVSLHREIDRLEARADVWNSGESRMERAMAARFSGQSQEGYYSDEDYAQGEFGEAFASLDRVAEWLNKNCPLLVASVTESELAAQAQED
jgi:hypothetical protein